MEYFEPAITTEIDPILYKLCNGDLSKSQLIENMDFEYCIDWFYLTKIKELNDLKLRVAEWEKIKNSD